MAILRQGARVAKLILFLYFMFHAAFVVTASDYMVQHWNDPSEVSDVEAGNMSFVKVPSSVSIRPSAGNIKLRDIPQVISLALGFSSLQDIDWDGLSAGSIFNHPKANVLFIIDGVNKSATVPFSGTSPTFTIVKNKASSDLDLFRVSPVRNFASHISSMLNDKPLVVSFSVRNKYAKASSASGKNAYTVSWDADERAFTDEANQIELSREELIKMFETADFGKDVKFVREEHKFFVSVPGMKDVSFDMNQMDDFLFFAEIQTLFYLYEKVKRFDSLIHDNFVDFFTFDISSLKGLVSRYGNGSHRVSAALHILHNVIPKVTKLFNDLYGGKALVEVVTLKSKESDKQALLPNESDGMYKGDERELRFRRDISERKTAHCKKNKKNLAIVDAYYDNEFPPIFNIVLWLMIILVLSVYGVSVVMWYMDPGRDSVIYRVTSQRMKSE